MQEINHHDKVFDIGVKVDERTQNYLSLIGYELIFKNVYEEWIVNNNYNLNKVKLITSLIFLNMSALHEEEFGNLLFFKAKEMLQQFYDR